MKKLFLNIFIFVSVFVVSSLSAEDRFPQPEFESGYQLPTTEVPMPDGVMHEMVDVAVLFLALSLSSFFLLRLRSRRATFILMLFSLLYFGFYRKGCICSIGAIQNVLLALTNQQWVLPLVIISFFCLPLIFTLLFGRTFCAAVCPLGSMQDLVLLRPMKIKQWLLPVLGLIPHFYLGFSVLFAATGAMFLICRYDPFVSFFRFSNDFNIILYSSAFLILSVFIARPYCRFLCPYGVLLGWFSKLSWKHVTITPNECIECRLCEDACPFDAIQLPTTGIAPENRNQGVKRLSLMLVLLPLVAGLSGFGLSRLDHVLSKTHPKVRLAERIYLEDAGLAKGTTLESRTFRSMGISQASLMEDAHEIRSEFRLYGWWIGFYFGLMVMLKLISVSVWRSQESYSIDTEACVSCGRCFAYCPKERNNG